ncbi:Glu/Leu/Phe/Val dehydrogenase dimerization domain-containing protein [Streptomyces axinellae]|uniref:Glu/Leu/Phe/Val dehydrogenase dimerization domain-containing protein n=1 Tax=Streptomyces axinellae TaxID=552788 RepID=UPI0031D8C6CD
MTGAAASRSPEASIVWTDPVTGRQAFLVIDRLIRGLASGGLRMREGCTYEEVRRLAAAMSVKEALHHNPADRHIPMGGAKGGIDCDPLSDEAPGVLARFLSFIRSYLENNWATGDDLGTTTEAIEDVLDGLGIDGCIAPVMRVVDDPIAARKRFDEAFSVEVGGIGLAELVGGCGVAEAVLAALDKDGIPRNTATAVVQGFGSMGGATARFLHEAGVRVVGIADVHGTVANPDGLPVEDMLRDRLRHGLVNRERLRAGDVLLDRDDWLALQADVLVPAAASYAIHAQNESRISARYIVEAANLPVTADAEASLHKNGVLTIPDVVANSGTNAWWWWIVFGDVLPEAAPSFAKIRTSLRSLVTETLDLAAETGTTPREAAHRVAEARRETLALRPELS